MKGRKNVFKKEKVYRGMAYELIEQYFPDLTEVQKEQFKALEELYKDWNEKINVISRKDTENIFERHILHSLCIARLIELNPGSSVLDLGTGGGFPGIPMAIMFPKTQFTLIDGTKKKIKVVTEIANAIGLKNVRPKHLRAEDCTERFDFVITRAVAGADKLMNWSRRLIKKKQEHTLPNGIIALKGGDIERETSLLGKREYHEIYPLRDLIDREMFEDKYILYIQW
jgi:16S rRNA (guanine527-N7)-methyltransferase